MSSEIQTKEIELLDAGIQVLAGRLPDSWKIQKEIGENPDEYDLTIRSPHGINATSFFVEARSTFNTRDIEQLLGGLWRRIRKLSSQQIIIVAEYIGPSVRELLILENISFVDLTGNVRISVDNPPLYIETQGASKDPSSTKTRASVNGPKAGGVVRFLIDVAPPYSGVDIARAARVNEGYASRILDTLRDEGIIKREINGRVTQVDWVRLLHRRGDKVDLFKQSNGVSYIAREGAPAFLNKLKVGKKEKSKVVVTGSFAASRLAPIASPVLLVLYSDNPSEFASEHELLRVTMAANVVVMRPESESVESRAKSEGGISWASPSQVAIDCLGGNGRMPAEGEAVIGWMRDDERRWRLPSLQAFIESEEQRRH